MQTTPSGHSKASIPATGDWATFCRTCGTIEQYDLDDALLCCIDEYGNQLECNATGNECTDHPREYYIYCPNMHALLVGNPNELFFHGTLRGLRTFCGYCRNNKCACIKR